MKILVSDLGPSLHSDPLTKRLEETPTALDRWKIAPMRERKVLLQDRYRPALAQERSCTYRLLEKPGFRPSPRRLPLRTRELEKPRGPISVPRGYCQLRECSSYPLLTVSCVSEPETSYEYPFRRGVYQYRSHHHCRISGKVLSVFISCTKRDSCCWPLGGLLSPASSTATGFINARMAPRMVL